MLELASALLITTRYGSRAANEDLPKRVCFPVSGSLSPADAVGDMICFLNSRFALLRNCKLRYLAKSGRKSDGLSHVGGMAFLGRAGQSSA
jgi:hypothetical protein